LLEIAGVAVSFVLILCLVNRKVHLVYAMFAAAGALLVTSPLGIGPGLRVAWQAAVARQTLEFALTVSLIGALARLMQEFGLLGQMVDALVRVLRSTKAALVAVPGLIGLLPVLGGAVISAPLVDRLSDRLGYSPERRSAVNLVFRHSWFFIYPFGPSLILTSQLSGLTVGELAGYQWPITLVALIAGYLLLLRDGNREDAPAEPWNPARDIPAFLVAGGPLLLSLTLALIGRLPLYAALAAGILLALALGRRHPKRRWQTALRGVDYKLAAAMIGVMVFRSLMQSGGAIQRVVMSASGNGWPPAVFFAAAPLLVGLISASQSTSVAICYPLLMPMLRPGDPVLPYASLVFVSTFVAYFGSPLHMCQILTLEHFRCRVLAVYRVYWPYLVAIGVTAAALFALRA
jgi:integral membrane protein (TIGR00529 family)